MSANWTEVLTVSSLFSLLSKCFLIEVRFSSWGMLGYGPTTSIVHRIAFLDKLPNSLRFLRKWSTSLMYDSTFLARGSKW